MADETQPIVFKKVKKGGHGHHGGAWKIAYADFVTAMMAFFLLMWLMGSTTREEKAAIADYFSNPSAVSAAGGASTSIIKMGGGKDLTFSSGDIKQGSNPDPDPKESLTKIKPDIASEAEKKKAIQQDKERLLGLKDALEKAINGIEALKPFKDQLLLEITKEGLRIQIVDKENRPMFDLGSSVMKDYTVTILHELGKLINHVPNKISLAGHTDARPYPRPNYTNWELSADRANASRRELVIGGMDDEKVARVVGLSSVVPFDKQDPTNPINRRISIVVLNKESEEAILYEMDNQDQPVMAAPVEKTSQVPAKPAAAPVATSSPGTKSAPLAAAPAVATQVAKAETRPSAPAPLSKLAPSNAAAAAAAAASAAAAAAQK